ncbi:MAG TPA: zf-HC2 domain-containing protein [Gemmatimonadaceae bacterium]|nr:zf-HC2 domain-containing protein [Gemmatimonadaceae bacterium]
MSCEAFDDLLAGYLEGDLGPAQRKAVEAHLASCVRCAALVRDLEQIRHGAGELGELSPSRDLWAGIASRIEAPVVPLTGRSAPNVASPRPAERLRLIAVAAALMAVTAGVTYTLTVSQRGNAPGESVAQAVKPSPGNVAGPVAPNDSPASSPAGQALASANTARDPQESAEPRATTQAVRNTAPAEVSSSREIDRLRSVFLRNRAQLDPRTAAIIEANLKVIDDAIAQSKAALAQDPASRFLNNQLNIALDKKLDLLRTAAQLPSRT